MKETKKVPSKHTGHTAHKKYMSEQAKKDKEFIDSAAHSIWNALRKSNLL